MDRLEKLVRLQTLVKEAGGKVEGRKKLHKLVYLCQRAGVDLDQSFVFYMYGVYSPSLALDVKTATGWGLLKEQVNRDAYHIVLGDAIISQNKAEDREQPFDFAIARTLAAETATVLEVLSTIVYLYDNQYQGEDLQAKLISLKGHLRKDFPRAYTLAATHFGLSPEQIGAPEPSASLAAQAR